MGKHDMPSLQFTVEGGRLVPAGPYEAEMLGSYSRGAQLTVTLHQKRSLPLLKKYWAVLRDVVDNCKTPWNSSEEASDAIKLALGVTDTGKTITGQWFIRPGSISFNSMDQAEFRVFFDKAMAVLAGVTGIDPDELSKRYSHIAEQEQHSSAAPSADEGRDVPPSSDVSPDPSPSEPNSDDETGEPASETADGQTVAGSPADPVKSELMRECVDNMIRAATDPDKHKREAQVTNGYAAWKRELPNDEPFVTRVFETCCRLINDPDQEDTARKYLMSKVV